MRLRGNIRFREGNTKGIGKVLTVRGLFLLFFLINFDAIVFDGFFSPLQSVFSMCSVFRMKSEVANGKNSKFDAA